MKTTIPTSESDHFFVGLTLIINGVRYRVMEQNNNALTIQYESFIEHIKSKLYYWKRKALFLYWDIVLEIEENWEAFREYIDVIRPR